ncbi:2-methylisocitrate lyase-like PEP mutase family enzyme [Streptacidiphilus sp. MAP12-16]|uniref:isocitrate lyase/PEP mutase family protein n=1 Tax=Streptacidiphilus sp. MAP12-16 TaxID=3156300 RepID=UPI00351893B5
MTEPRNEQQYEQRSKAALFRSLHRPGSPLALANAWDVVSARVVEEAGAPAVATTSAGVAWGLGAADGDELDRDQALALIARVASAVRVPVTADIESGFGADASEVAATVVGVVAAGAVGVNIEDSLSSGSSPLRPVAEQAERIAAARRAADQAGVALYVNARIDTYLGAVGEPGTRLQETLARAEAYLGAGADGIFVPGTTDPAVVSALVEGIRAPLNILVGPGGPSIGELSKLGVARVSLGSAVAGAAYDLVRRAARELLTTGTYTELTQAMSHAELNALMRGESRRT